MNQTHAGGDNHSYGKIKGKRPAARDGHSGLLYGGRYFVVFGGDRHHMPFNDTFILDVKAEITSKSFLFWNNTSFYLNIFSIIMT